MAKEFNYVTFRFGLQVERYQTPPPPLLSPGAHGPTRVRPEMATNLNMIFRGTNWMKSKTVVIIFRFLLSFSGFGCTWVSKIEGGLNFHIVTVWSAWQLGNRWVGGRCGVIPAHWLQTAHGTNTVVSSDETCWHCRGTTAAESSEPFQAFPFGDLDESRGAGDGVSEFIYTRNVWINWRLIIMLIQAQVNELPLGHILFHFWSRAWF